MLDNKFDQIFRDRLLDHPSMVRHGLWKQVHTHLVRYTAFWKWYVVGPSAIAIAVTGYFLVAAFHSPATSTTQNLKCEPKATATAAHPTAAAASAIPGANAIPGTSATTNRGKSATRTATATRSKTATPTTTTNASASAQPFHHHRRSAAHPTTGSTNTAPESIATTSATTSQTTNPANPAPATHPPIPAQLTSPAKLAILKTRPAVAAITPNPRKPHQAILPARPPRKTPQVRLDAFGAPEYFTLKVFGLSYGAGFRATVVFKNHWTFTTGLQYLRIDVTGKGKDSADNWPPGTIKNLHLPLLLGYTTANERFTFSANAGILLSLYAHNSGEMTYTGLWPNRNGLSALLGLNFATHVTNKVSIFAEPYLKCWFPQPRNQFLGPTPTIFPPKAWSTGLMLGVRFNF